MEPPDFDLSSAVKSYGPVQLKGVGHGIPSQIAQSYEPGCPVPSRDSVGAESAFGQDNAANQDVLIPAVEVEQAGQSRKFVIPQEPGISVNGWCQ
jgi:hypothetical protein